MMLLVKIAVCRLQVDYLFQIELFPKQYFYLQLQIIEKQQQQMIEQFYSLVYFVFVSF